MPLARRRRTRRSRFLAPVGLGVAALLTLGSVVAGAPPGLASSRPGPAVALAVGRSASPAAPAGPANDPHAPAGSQADRWPQTPLPLQGEDLAIHHFDAPPIAGLVGYLWPLPHGRVTLPFGPTPWGEWIVDGVSIHDGVDLATFCGDRVVAAHDGTVLAAGRRFDDSLGWLGDLTPYRARLGAKQLWGTLPIVVVVDDGNGYRSVYAHFGRIVVTTGARVRAGDLLGYEGRTGHASGCHLHYGLFSPFERDRFALDPAIAARMHLPAAEIARVDPLAVLPARPSQVPLNGGGSAAR